MTCPVCDGTRWTRVRFMEAGAPPAVLLLSRCDGCGLRACHAPTDVPDTRPQPESPGSGGMIRYHHLLESFVNPVAELQRAAGRLAAGGAILVTAEDAGSFGARLLGGAWPGWEPVRQRWVFDAPTLRRAIERAGLEPVYVRRAMMHGLLMARAERR